MHREETRKAAEVMMHYANGGEVQLEKGDGGWMDTEEPNFAWDCCHYRIKPKPIEVVVYALIELETGRICSYHITEAMAAACLVELRSRGRKGLVIQCKGTYTCDT